MGEISYRYLAIMLPKTTRLLMTLKLILKLRLPCRDTITSQYASNV